MIQHLLSFINSNSEISSQLSCFLVVILTIVNLDDNNQPALVYLLLIGRIAVYSGTISEQTIRMSSSEKQGSGSLSGWSESTDVFESLRTDIQCMHPIYWIWIFLLLLATTCNDHYS